MQRAESLAHQGHYIGGQEFVDPTDTLSDVYNPALGGVTSRVFLAGQDTVEHAVHAASAAYLEWRHTSLSQRSSLMFRLRNHLTDRINELARAITIEHGKTFDDSTAEVQRGIEVVEAAAGIASGIKGGYSENVSSATDTHTVRQPLGVVAGVTPFNFPVMLPLWMAPLAIACGNTFILKPSERDPSAPLMLAEAFSEVGFPPGVFNIVNGAGPTVEMLISHPQVRAVSFVGSTPVARRVYSLAAESGKRVQALAGAKNHMVVLPDADLSAAADAAVSAAYGSVGERCMAISVVVAVGEVADSFVAEAQARIERLRVGPGLDTGVDLGPLVTGGHLNRVKELVAAGHDEGAELVVDGRELTTGSAGGFFLGPTLFDRVTPDMAIYKEEIFGPVLCVVRVNSLDEAIDLIDRNPWGNGSAIFTRNGVAARKFQQEVATGMVGINVPIPVPVASYSFGGWKDSLFGDSHVYGDDAIRFYTRQKVVVSRWNSPEPAQNLNLTFPQNS